MRTAQPVVTVRIGVSLSRQDRVKPAIFAIQMHSMSILCTTMTQVAGKLCITETGAIQATIVRKGLHICRNALPEHTGNSIAVKAWLIAKTAMLENTVIQQRRPMLQVCISDMTRRLLTFFFRVRTGLKSTRIDRTRLEKSLKIRIALKSA